MNDPLERGPSDDPYIAPRQRENPGAPEKGGSCLMMFILWVLPAVLVPLIVVVFAPIWPVGVVVAVALLTVMGNMYAGDAVQGPGGYLPRWPKVLLYVVIQMVLIPLIAVALVLGFCALAGTGRF